MNGVACRPSATSLNSCSYTIQPRCPPKNSVAIECTSECIPYFSCVLVDVEVMQR